MHWRIATDERGDVIWQRYLSTWVSAWSCSPLLLNLVTQPFIMVLSLIFEFINVITHLPSLRSHLLPSFTSDLFYCFTDPRIILLLLLLSFHLKLYLPHGSQTAFFSLCPFESRPTLVSRHHSSAFFHLSNVPVTPRLGYTWVHTNGHLVMSEWTTIMYVSAEGKSISVETL